jgi:hypothetical protein
MKGHRSLRVGFAAWWEENTGQVVPELLDDGQILHYSQLHKRTRPKRPKDPREDRRWTDDEVLGWPISHDDFERWARERHWQFARTMPNNPHSYTHRAWGHEETFLRIVQHLREYGRQEVYGGDLYTYYVANGFKHWTMGADLMSTILINRKPVGQDEGDEETEERSGEVPSRISSEPNQERRELDRLQRISRESGCVALVLLCYEDLQRPDVWCHRTMLCDWVNERGVEIKELEAGNLAKRQDAPQPALFEQLSREERI